ncbi:MAG: putative oxidoreductase [Chthoniobacter sp.]|jgi:putative oxidoreductase|nr:putative oxidoreductase [Chthoniobacter sp.]
MILSFLGKYREGGLLFMRIGLGVLFIVHGIFLVAGPHWWTWHSLTAHWHKTGALGMEPVGMHSYLTLWGALAFLSEFVGGILLILGFCFRPACLFLAITMTMAAIMHSRHGDDFNLATSRAIEMAIVFWALLLVGPGRYSIDKS